MDNDKMMTTRDILCYLRIGKSTLRKLLREEELPVIMITGRKHLFRKSDIDAWIQRRQKGKGA